MWFCCQSGAPTVIDFPDISTRSVMVLLPFWFSYSSGYSTILVLLPLWFFYDYDFPTIQVLLQICIFHRYGCRNYLGVLPFWSPTNLDLCLFWFSYHSYILLPFYFSNHLWSSFHLQSGSPIIPALLPFCFFYHSTIPTILVLHFLVVKNNKEWLSQRKYKYIILSKKNQDKHYLLL